MTAQVSETLIYHGKELMMFSNPLDPYLRATGIEFVSPHTACWRGYEGTWEIKGTEPNEGLYLVALQAHRSYEDIANLGRREQGARLCRLRKRRTSLYGNC